MESKKVSDELTKNLKNNRFKIIQKIGEGSESTVFKVEDMKETDTSNKL